MSVPTRMVLMHKTDPRAKVHELDCPWLNGRNAKTNWTRYERLPANSPKVAGRPHCRYCA
jgi:hypothetical protein